MEEARTLSPVQGKLDALEVLGLAVQMPEVTLAQNGRTKFVVQAIRRSLPSSWIRNRIMPRCCWGMLFLFRPAESSDGSSASYQADDRHDDGKHQQQVNQAAGDVESPSKQPQDEQNRKNGPEHGLPPVRPRIAHWAANN